MFELKHCSKGVGMFATKNIPKGTIIFTEKPIMLNNSLTLDNISPKDYIVLSIKYLVENYYEDFIKLAPKIVTNNNEHKNYNFDKLFRECPETKRGLYLTKYVRNAFNFGKNRYCMLFLGCKLNHDCNPNTEFYKKNDVMVFKALTNIKKGEEITDTYTSSEAYNGMSDKLRKTKILQQYGFLCECNICKNIPI